MLLTKYHSLCYTKRNKAMEALWNLEDKLKLSTQDAVILFVFVAFALIALCTATILKKKAKREQLPSHDMVTNDTMIKKWPESSCGWVSIMKVLMGSMRWSSANKSEERSINGNWGESPTPLLGLRGCEFDVGVSPVWQRPILMGEKCELPRFSGLILYDEQGRLLSESQKEISCKENIHHQVINQTTNYKVLKIKLLHS